LNKHSIAFGSCLVVIAGGTGLALGQSGASLTTHYADARYDKFDKTTNTLQFTDCKSDQSSGLSICGPPSISISVSDKGLQSSLTSFGAGDHVDITTDGKVPASLVTISIKTNPSADQPISLVERLGVLASSAASLVALSSIVVAIRSGSKRWNPLLPMVGQDGRYSNSTCQMGLWFLILISTYLDTVILRVFHAGTSFIGGVNIPQNLFLLSGMSALTFAGAKGITTAKQNTASQAKVIAAAVATAGGGTAVTVPTKTTSNDNPSLFRDLLSNDNGQFDFGDFQMLVVTILAVGIYITQILHFTAFVELHRSVMLPDLDTTILASFGIGQGAYLAKKAAGNLGSS